MDDTLGVVMCCDCQTLCPVSLGLIIVRKGRAQLALCTLCPVCVKVEGKITLRGYITLPRRELVEACERGLPALEVV